MYDLHTQCKEGDWVAVQQKGKRILGKVHRESWKMCMGEEIYTDCGYWTCYVEIHPKVKLELIPHQMIFIGRNTMTHKEAQYIAYSL